MFTDNRFPHEGGRYGHASEDPHRKQREEDQPQPLLKAGSWPQRDHQETLL